MAQKPEIINIKREFGSLAESAAVEPVPQSRALVVPQKNSPEDTIAQGGNPYQVWRHFRYAMPAEAAKAMRVSLSRYLDFEGGHYLGLRDEHIVDFCRAMQIHPASLIENKPMPGALLNVLLTLVSSGTTLRARETARYNLYNHCDDAVTALRTELQRCRQASYGQDIVLYLDLLAHPPAILQTGQLDPQKIYAMLMDYRTAQVEALDSKARYMGAQIKNPRDPLVRDYGDACLRLYGPDNVASSWKTLLALNRAFKPPVVRGMVHGNPEILGPMIWDGGAQSVNGRFVGPTGAIDILLDAHDALVQRHNQSERHKKVVVTNNLQLDRLREWAMTKDAARVMDYWRNRQQIVAALGQDRPFRLDPALLPAPESAKKSFPHPGI